MPVLNRRRVRRKRNLGEELAKEFLQGTGIDLTSAAEVAALRGTGDDSQDYVSACQVLESCNNVLAAFHAMHRVLKPGGVLFLSVSGQRGTKEATALGHLAADFVHGPDLPDGVRQHCWTPITWMELILAVQAGLGMELEAVRRKRTELITVMRKPR